MLFNLDVNFNGEHLVVSDLDTNGYGYVELVNDVCGVLGEEWLGQLVSFEGVYPCLERTFPIKGDEDLQALLHLYLSIERTTININLKLQTCSSQLSQITQLEVTQNQSKICHNEPEVIRNKHEVTQNSGDNGSDGSNGGEAFYWSDSSHKGGVIEFLDDSITANSNLLDYDLDSAEDCKGIEDEDENKDAVRQHMGKVADKMQGDYFEKVLDEKIGKWIIEFKQGHVFDNVYHLRKILHEYCMEKGVKLRKKANDKQKVIVECSVKGCPFRLYVSPFVDGITFKIKTLNPMHKCIRNLPGIGKTFTWIASIFENDFKANINKSIDEMANILKQKYGVEVPRKKLYRAKSKAIDLVSGEWAESYALMPRYVQAVKNRNPTSCVKLKCDDMLFNNPKGIVMFDRVFISFNAQRDGFVNGCKPFIGLDGCFLKGPFEGQLLTVVSLNANSSIFPLAMMVCTNESEDAWWYFLECLSDFLGTDRSITFMSDRQKGLQNAFKKHCSNDRVSHCARHLYANFRKKYHGVRLRKLFCKAVKAYNQYEFGDYMEEIKNVDPDAYKWLMIDWKVDLQSWAMHEFDAAAKSDHVTNNMSESFNATLVTYRGKPILTLLEWIRKKVMKMFYTRYQRALEWKSRVPPRVLERIEKNFQDERHMHPCESTKWIFQVHDHEGKSFIVNLHEMTCQCREWQISGIPCKHAMICITIMRYDPTEYVHPYLIVDAYKMTYQGMINLVPDQSIWLKVNCAQVLPLKKVIKRGRPKMNRIREVGEPVKHLRSIHGRCSQCKEMGHNKITCLRNGSRTSRKKKSKASIQHQTTMDEEPSQSSQVGQSNNHLS